MPFACSLTRRAQDPSIDVRDQSRILGDGDECGRREKALLRMVPADQRFEPGQPGVAQVDDRLIVHLELVPFDGTAESGLEL